MAKQTRRFHGLSDGELVDLLYTAGDQLPRAAVNEALRRGPRLIAPLHAIVAEKSSWTRPVPEWWAAVHATYILGAMENPATLGSLLTALRWADAFDCDWVTEDLPSIFGRLGGCAADRLEAILADATAGWGARSIALCSLASIAIALPYRLPPLLAKGAELLADETQDYEIRQTAANILLDFRAGEHRELLMAFGREEAARRADDPEYQGVFYDWEVDEFLQGAEGGDPEEYYRRDWLQFYDPEETKRRQERWAREQEEAEREGAEDAPAPRRDRGDPCPCGSGRSFESCCYLKVH